MKFFVSKQTRSSASLSEKAFAVIGSVLFSFLVVSHFSVALTSCKQSIPDSEVSFDKKVALLSGTWESLYGEVFTIDVNAGTFDTGSISYAGDNMTVSFDTGSDDAGYIYFKYTRAFCLEHSDFANYVYTYDTDAPDVGNWYAVRFEGLTDSSVKLSGAYGAKSSTATLEEAKTEFTVANGYFAAFSNCDSSRSVSSSFLFYKK